MTHIYIVPTPIGNLEDITFRAIKVLKEVDFILAEDTRKTGILLKHFDISTKMHSHHLHNEHKTVEYFLSKILTGESAALVSDAGTPAISDPGYFNLPGDSHRFRDHKKSGHGAVNLHKAEVVSCDTYFYILSYRMGIEKMNDWMRQFGFGEKTGVDLPSESTGLYPSPEWKMRTRKSKLLKGETISVSIGQGAFTATPLQLAMATAITANKGSHITPHVLRENKGAKKFAIHNAPDGKIQFNGTEQDWLNMHAAMIDVIQSGTGRGIKCGLQYSIAGKTGTAQVKSIAQGKRYNEAALSSRQWDHGLFVGFAPADNPEIAIAVVWENGKHGGSAAQLARPIFDYWLVTRKKNPLRPANHQVSGGLMTAGIKPGELPSGGTNSPA